MDRNINIQIEGKKYGKLLEFQKDLIKAILLSNNIFNLIFIDLVFRILSTSGIRRVDPVNITAILLNNINIYYDKELNKLKLYVMSNDRRTGTAFIDTFISYINTFYTLFFSDPSFLEYVLEHIIGKKVIIIPLKMENLRNDLLVDLVRNSINNYIREKKIKTGRKGVVELEALSYEDLFTADYIVGFSLLKCNSSKNAEEICEAVGAFNSYIKLFNEYYREKINKIIGELGIKADIEISIKYRSPSQISIIPGKNYDVNKFIHELRSYYQSVFLGIKGEKYTVKLSEAMKNLLSAAAPILLIEIGFNESATVSFLYKEIIKTEIIRRLSEI